MLEISIIIPTINRYYDLQNTINDLYEQTVQDFEIIIIDQTNEPIAKKIKGNKITYIHKSYKSASKARNYGLAIAKAEIILFLDDDVIIENNDFLKFHLDNYRENHELSGVFGSILNTSKELVSTLPSELRKKHLGWMFFPKNYDKPYRIGNGISCNLSVRKSFAIEIGGMDENYDKGAHREESDFCFRLSKKYGKLNYDPKTFLIHIGNPKGGIRSWDDVNSIVHAKQHMVGSWYFMLTNLPIICWFEYSYYNVRRFIIHKKLIYRFYLLPLAIFRFVSSFFIALSLRIRGPKYLKSDMHN